MKTFVGEIYITPHAKMRFIERRINVTKYDPKLNVYKKMRNMIYRSELIKSLKKPDGRIHEYREYKGCIFVCEREFSKDFWKKDLVTVITVELTTGFIMRTIDKVYPLEELSLNSYILDKLKKDII
ncbi:hypothetical protein [Clostridium sp.]|uniref:hypothetical protein n=1 Tax=Clostridium sp. TaxID=1506 RepID=UPI0029086CC1|nr:hypothetical protein [Clostridium sp.]MDU7240408.1 hypothetical protein [Clostridium sp.]